MSGSYLGPAFDDDEIGRRLTAAGARFARLGEEELLDQTVNALAVEKAVGWFQGRMEFGPRALGARSILADARSPRMQRILNLKVKYRESFRPFAPSVLREDVGDWFELDRDSPYMLIVADVAVHRRRAISAAERDFFGIDKLNVPRSEIPAVTHVDFSARIQTVHRETNPRYHALLTRFKASTTGIGSTPIEPGSFVDDWPAILRRAEMPPRHAARIVHESQYYLQTNDPQGLA